MPVLEPSPAVTATATATPTPTPTPTQRWHAPLLALVSARRAGSLTLQCLLAWPVALLPSGAFLGMAYGLGLALGIDMAFFEAPEREVTFTEFFGMVIFAPLVETLLLAGLLALLSRMSRRPLFVAAASGALWGCLHGAFGLLWLFGIFWSFYVFSCSYLAWRQVAWWKAYVVAAVPHALINLTAFSLLLLE